MLELLIVLTVLEVVLLVAALAGYLVIVLRGLRDIGKLLDQISFGVRAIDTQTARVVPDTQLLESTLDNTVELLEVVGVEPSGRGRGSRSGS